MLKINELGAKREGNLTLLAGTVTLRVTSRNQVRRRLLWLVEARRCIDDLSST